MAEGTAMGGESLGERVFAGVSEGRMTEVVAERDRLGEVFVQAERAGYGA